MKRLVDSSRRFRVRKEVIRKGRSQTEWVAMRKGVAWLFCYRKVSLMAHSRYLHALAVVDDPTKGLSQNNGSTLARAAGGQMQGAATQAMW